jgi:putative addiction module component (TIGR02574 family)
MKNSERHEIFGLPLQERLQLVEDLWDSIALETTDVPVTLEQRRELDFRLAALEDNPDSGDTWENVKSRLIQRNE